ncbi:MAG: rhodanese-like domain-containing protein [Actinomycetaceae bacterium]|nr:rhodanese-like domain-containing protein [Actinomycetaceae bacterium]
MKKIKTLTTLVLMTSLCFSLGACATSTPESASSSQQESAAASNEAPAQEGSLPWGKHTDIDTFKQALAKDDVVILDVRTPGEYSSGHIPDSINIDALSPDFAQKIADLDPQKNYAIYCRSGNRSRSAQSQMASAGFEKTIGLEGGIGAWDGPTE